MVLKVAYSKDDREDLVKKGFKKIGTAEDKEGNEIVIYRSTRKKRTTKVKSEPEKVPTGNTRSSTPQRDTNTNPNPTAYQGNRNRNQSN